MRAIDRLAGFSSEVTWGNIPRDVQEHIKDTLFNYVAVGIGGSRDTAVHNALTAIQLIYVPGSAPVFGNHTTFHPMQAAFINGIAAHVDDFDDTHLATVIHPGAPVTSAALAVAADLGATGADLLTAIAVGCEVALRVGMGVTPEHYDLGWHITGTCGVFGAAAAVGSLLHLSPDAMRRCLGLASSQASGVREAFGTMTKSLHIGNAAANGVLSAMLASDGFTSAANVLEGPHSFSEVYAGTFHESSAVNDIGGRWEVMQNTFKPYPCGVVTHPIIDAGLQLNKRIAGSWKQIRRIHLDAHPLVLELTGKLHPKTQLDAKFSAYYCLAASIHQGEFGIEQFYTEVVLMPEISELQDLIDIRASDSLSRDACALVAELKNGTTVEIDITDSTGSLVNPISNEALRTKGRTLIDPVLGNGQSDCIYQTIQGLNTARDVTMFVRALAPQEGVNAE